MIKKIKEAIDIQEAIDNLVAISEIDLSTPPPIAIIRGVRLVVGEEGIPSGAVPWLSEEGEGAILDLLDDTFRALSSHLFALSERVDGEKGVTAMMALAAEAAEKMERYLAFRLGKPLESRITERESFRVLKQFYAQKFSRETEKHDFAPSSKGEKIDFEAVQRDEEYELFFIRNEEGEPYFKPDLMRKIQINLEFEGEGISFEEDPLLKTRTMQDRDFHASAVQILAECRSFVEEFFKTFRKLAKLELANVLSQAVFALFLAANPHHLIQNGTGKSCLQYFKDFHQFLRQAMRTPEYQKWVAYPPEKGEKGAWSLLFLTHLLCKALFHRVGGIKQEVIGLLYRSMRRGEELSQEEHRPLLEKNSKIWNQFLFEDEKLREFLKRFPNGPLFRVFDRMREEEKEVTYFDPIAQGNIPYRLYEIERAGGRLEVLHIPSPTRQAFIHKAEIVGEFRGFLRALGGTAPPKKHLLIHLQDRASWRECARSQALEALQKSTEFGPQLLLLSLPKSAEFYWQSDRFADLDRAEEFLAAVRREISFPEIEKILSAVHIHFFEGKERLVRREREDFLEIFYQFLVLKAIDFLEPDFLSFTCKDAIDAGAAQGATFYAFLALLKGSFAEKEAHDFFRWLLYAPALLIRERPIHGERVYRALSALERIEEKKEGIAKAFGPLYSAQLFNTIYEN